MPLPRVNTAEVLRVLAELYPDAECALDHQNAFELLIATILSAQCTDKRVNMITPRLFAEFPDAAGMAYADTLRVEQLIAECGLYKMKSRNIVGASRMIVEQYGGSVPETMDELLTLPGVGRKTANVVLSNAFGVPAIAVDTHVQRVSNRIGLAQSEDVVVTEQQLMRRIPRAQWSRAHHWLIYHGRQVCTARAPKCSECALAPLCRYFKQQAVYAKSARAY